MYGKVYSQIFDGTLHGKIHATAVFMAMIAIADVDGGVDRTAESIAAITGWPLEFVLKGIDELQQPDPRSRTPDHDGRRIIPLRPHTDWGWRIVNYLKYREIRDDNARREYQREWVKNKRASTKHKSTVDSVDSRLSKSTNAEVEEEERAPSASVPGLDQQAWDLWMQYRREIKKALKPVSIPSAQRAMAALGAGQMAAVEHTKANGWTGLRAPESVKTKARGMVV